MMQEQEMDREIREELKRVETQTLT